MAVKLGQLANNNLLNLSTWTVGTGSVTGFTANGAAAESQRLNDTGPWGASVLVWQTNPTATSDADGGWEGSYVNIDNTKLYRYSVWVRRTSATSGGTFYFGLHSNGTGDVYSLSDGGSQTNPYFDYRGTGWFELNLWYLVVGHVYPASYTGTSANPESGIYTRANGKVGINAGNVPNDCKWGAGATQGMNRTYHYYCADATTHLQFFSPRIDLVDGTQPPINSLLSQNLVSPSSLPEGVLFSDGTLQTTKYDSVIDTGKPMSISVFNASGTWTKPAGCTNVLVRVVGGGGGGASYCESGGAGGYAEKRIDVTTLSTVAITVGNGGAYAAYAGGNAGGTSSFGAYCSASGGYGSNQNFTHGGGHGGVGSGGDINLYGGTGTGHCNTTGHGQIGRGGESFWGGSNGINRNSNPSQVYWGSPGTGGTGGITDTGQVGTNGQPGLVVVWEYK